LSHFWSGMCTQRCTSFDDFPHGSRLTDQDVILSYSICRGPNVSFHLTFTGPCIAIYSYSKTNQMHLFLKLFILVKHSTCFGRSLRPSSGAQDCTYSNRHMSNRYCYRNRCILLVLLQEYHFITTIVCMVSVFDPVSPPCLRTAHCRLSTTALCTVFTALLYIWR
jgi:hypothetical protein